MARGAIRDDTFQMLSRDESLWRLGMAEAERAELVSTITSSIVHDSATAWRICPTP